MSVCSFVCLSTNLSVFVHCFLNILFFHPLGCIAIGCRTDPDCPLDRACRNRDCINPCLTDNPCGSNAECLVSQHLAQCRCIFGYTGDPYQACLPFEPPECVEDKDCPTDQVCINEKCINPCLTLSPCVAPATCKLVSILLLLLLLLLLSYILRRPHNFGKSPPYF